MKIEQVSRVAAYWITTGLTCWTLLYFYWYGTEKGREWMREDLAEKLLSKYDITGGTAAKMVMATSPLLVATTVCLLFVTSTPLPRASSTWINYIFTICRRKGKTNQLGLGEANFDYLAIFLVIIPPFAYFMATMDRRLIGEDVTNERKMHTVANSAGIVGVLALSFFLIPVARHSVLLVAMGWSPVHALRIHVWAGFSSFFWIMLHGILYIVEWFVYRDEPVLDQIIPGSGCWAWRPAYRELSEREIERGRNPYSLDRGCSDQWYNFSGLIALLFFIILCVTSLNWFRRRYYRLFYIFHMTFGVGMLVVAVAHWNPLITYLMPSIVYYLASTAPALIQAAASRYRGGVQIKKIVHLTDAGGCKEVHVVTTPETNAALDNQPSMFVKLCVPSISLVWHPFTVFKDENDPTTVRFLFRPVGPFTKKLAAGVEQENPPITVLDGLYHTGNRCLEALQHDHVTIVCGGVAITPFLSMIPSILKSISKAPADSARTKRIVFHWACRERGLMTYVVDNYLLPMKQTADSMNFELDIIIHQTGKSKALDLDHGGKGGSSEDLQETKELSTMSKSFTTDPTETTHANRARDESSNTSSSGNEDADAVIHVGAGDEDAEQGSLEEETINGSLGGGGHAMELGRFMPAKYTKIWKNVPALLVVGGTMWVSFYICWYYYDNYTSYRINANYMRIWPLIVSLMSAVGIAIFFEGGSLLVAAHKQKSGATPVERTFESTAYAAVVVEGGDTVGCSSLEYRTGRPKSEDFSVGFDDAERPAIFCCGPVPLIENVKKEARIHNGIFGFIGVAVYEEPFEM